MALAHALDFKFLVVHRANPLGPHDLNTIQSLLEYKESHLFLPIPSSDSSLLCNSTYQFIAHWGDIGHVDYFIKESLSCQGYFGNNSLIPNLTSVIDGVNTLLAQYYDQITPLTSSKAYMVGPGNHGAS